MSDELQALENFNGTARLFPLPNLVLYPAVVQPLHIFEPRYREMMSDALKDDRLLALVLLQPGWEEDYHQRPPIHSIACLGRIFNEEELPDGRYNLLLHGLHRIRIESELPAKKLYRQARVQLIEDIPCGSMSQEQQLRSEMAQLLPPLLALHGGAEAQARQLLESDLALGVLSDVFAFALPLEMSFKQELLEELDVPRRARRLLSHLAELAPPQVVDRKFPPDFSPN